MKHQKIKELISLYMEGELDKEEKRVVEQHLKECLDCQKEFKLEEVLRKVEFKKPSKEIWETYWFTLYNRLERKIGWILFSIGSIILIFMGAYKLVEGLIKNPDIPLALKIGILVFIGGAIVLLVSIIREQVYMRKRERYKEVEK